MYAVESRSDSVHNLLYQCNERAAAARKTRVGTRNHVDEE